MGTRIEKITVPAQPGLDPVFVYFEDMDNGQGRVVLICWDMAWTAYWGAMGDRTIKQFFTEAGVDYIVGNLHGQFYKRGAVAQKYMEKIVRAVHSHLQAQKVAA